MIVKIETLDLTPEEIISRLGPGKNVVILCISKRITNDGKTVHGWRVEFQELKNENQGSG